MPDTTKGTVLYKLRYTPVLDFLRIGFTARLDPLRHLEAAALPIPIKQLIERVVQRTRLWRLEKLDVLTELIAHFTDGIASGVSPEDLIQAFGDETKAAQLIRRAKRRNRPLYWRSLHAALLFTLLTLLIGSPLLLVSAYVQRLRWNAMTRRIDALQVDAETRKENRTVLRETTVPGNAWDEYNLALGGSFPSETGNGSIFWLYATGNISNAAEKVKVEKLISSNAWRLEHLRRGALHAEGQLPHHWRLGSDAPSILRSRMLANLGAAQAKRLADSGRTQDAADVLLDVAVFAKDLSTNGPILSTLVGDAIYWTTFDKLGRLAVARKFNTTQMANLSRSLETIDREFPRIDALASNAIAEHGLFVTRNSVRVGDPSWWDDSKEMGWHFAISPRGYTTEAFAQVDLYLQRFAKIEDLPYAKARAEVDAITAEAQKSLNYFVRDEMPYFNLSQVLVGQRESRAMLRVLRASIAVLTTGKVPVLPDPFGTRILSRSDADGITVWSVGRDGTDQNGTGDYGQPDIVVKIPRIEQIEAANH